MCAAGVGAVPGRTQEGMTVIQFRPRQDRGTSAGGQFKETTHSEAPVSLGRHAAAPRPGSEIPESLRMAYFPDPYLPEELDGIIKGAAVTPDPRHWEERFVERLPHLPESDARERFYAAMDAYNDGEGSHGHTNRAFLDNSAGHPGGGLRNGYRPPVVTHGPGYMEGSRSVGEKAGGSRDAAVIAKSMREELKAATAGNYLPAGLQYSVTIDRYAGGQSINIEARGLEDKDRLHPTEKDHYGDPAWRPEAEELKKRIESIHSAFNDDSTNSMRDYFDSTFMGSVSIETDAGRAWREEEAAKAKAKRALRAPR
jgi:hypothetical protein